MIAIMIAIEMTGVMRWCPFLKVEEAKGKSISLTHSKLTHKFTTWERKTTF